jgi:prolyl oligopeptidase
MHHEWSVFMRDSCRLVVGLAVLGLLPSLGLAADQDPPGKRLHALFSAEWERSLRDFPDLASIYGFRRFNDAWPDLSLPAFEQRQKHRLEVLDTLKSFDPEKLSEQDRLYLAIFRSEYQVEAESHRRRLHLLPLNQMEGIHDLTPLIASLSFETVRDYEDWLARLRRFPTYVDQTILLMVEGVRNGRVQPGAAMKRVPGQLRRLVENDAEKHPLFKPFRKFPDTIAPADRERLTLSGREAVGGHVIPSYRKLLTFVEKDYLPWCYEGVGVWHLPDGAELYPFQIRLQTTTTRTPDEIHELGQKEVRRIRTEMEKIIREVGFQGTFAEFVADLRTNPKFYYKNPDDLLNAARDICKKVEGQLPKLFGRLPRTRYLVEPIPAHMAADSTGGYYHWPSADGRRPGTYFVNLSRLESRPKYQLEALSLHEAIPGHHLQISLAFEQESLPAFRRYSLGYNAYVEGWALYSESLGQQLGMYQDPYSRFGQLSYEIWRAVRLVVDTGMHHKKWTRQQAIDFAVASSASSLVDIENEIDRYAVWPGQALGYKIGELKIKELRARAEDRLKERFDIRAFHDEVLRTGGVPLDLLETRINAWIADVQRKGP